MPRLALVAGVCSACVLGCAAADAQPLAEARIQAVLDKGGGEMIVNAQMNPPSQTWSWSICDATGANCSPFAAGRQVEFGNEPANITFRATANDGPTALSPVWNGALTLLSAPSVTGPVEANSLVTPVPASWAGGWTGDESDFTQLAACATSDGRECTTLTDREFGGECAGGGTVLDPIFAGWYLRVASFVTGPTPAFAEVGRTTPYGNKAWQAGPSTAVAVVGRIARARRARTDQCGPPALDSHVSPREPMPVQSAVISASGEARVACWSDPCNAVLTARHGRAVRAKTLEFIKRGRLKVALAPATVIERGRLRYTLSVDGQTLARRNIYVRSGTTSG
jgi:hypothetical protein